MKNLAFGIYELNDGRYQASYVNPVTRKRKRHKFRKAKDAQEFKTQIEREFLSKNYAFFMESFVGQVIERHLNDHPESKLRDRENVFQSFYTEFAKLKMNQLTRQALKNWFDKIQVQHNYSERTLATIKSQIAWLFRDLIDDGLLQESPLSKIKFRRIVPPRRPRVVLSVNEVLQVLRNVESFSPTGLYPFLATVVHTGARRSEILRLSREDIDFATNLIHIKKSKNGRERFISLSPALAAILKNHLENHQTPSLFINEHGTKLDSNKELTRLITSLRLFSRWTRTGDAIVSGTHLLSIS